MMNLDSEIRFIKGVGPKRAEKFIRLGIETLGDLIHFYPRTYKDLSQITKISNLEIGKIQTIKAQVVSVSVARTYRRRMSIVTAIVNDDTGRLPIVWFNQPYIRNLLRKDKEYIFYGKLTHDRTSGKLQIQSPMIEQSPSIIPIYSETSGLSSKQIRSVIVNILSQAREIQDNLPSEIVAQENLMPQGKALWQIHKPSSKKELAEAHRRLALDELIDVITRFIKFERELSKGRAPRIEIDKELLPDFAQKLPFKLTDAQRVAAWTIITRMEGSLQNTGYRIQNIEDKSVVRDSVAPANVLLNGDVGSGKTVVALIASLAVINAGYNAVWLAPTEVLANQHFETVKNLLGSLSINVELVTGSTKARKNRCHPELVSGSREIPKPLHRSRNEFGMTCLAFCESRRASTSVRNDNQNIRDHPRLPAGEASSDPRLSASSLIIGTHAILHRKDAIQNIGLVVVDEQHRFGVEQRRQLLEHQSKTGLMPHFISMSATPIPRSLALIFSGMTDLITIKDKPHDRKSTITKIVNAANRQQAYRFIDHQIEKGRQVFVITPLINPLTLPTIRRHRSGGKDILSERSPDGVADEVEDKFLNYPSTRDYARSGNNFGTPQKLFKSERKAVTDEFEKLNKTIFKHRNVLMLHGQMKSREKESVMEKFSSGKADILVATSVVEVGVDVPNAAVMLIENAECFGLAQLHQFRGRVGRSHHQSYCFLAVGDEAAQSVADRLDILTRSNDGFAIAQKDLEMRGPGSIAGLDQSGFFDLKLANLGDTMMLEKAKRIANSINKSPLLPEEG